MARKKERATNGSRLRWLRPKSSFWRVWSANDVTLQRTCSKIKTIVSHYTRPWGVPYGTVFIWDSRFSNQYTI